LFAGNPHQDAGISLDFGAFSGLQKQQRPNLEGSGVVGRATSDEVEVPVDRHLL
jgi:hypothetical protein